MARILVIDDDPRIIAMLERGLRYEGFQVHTANSGEEGLDRFGQLPADLVILDVMLPGQDGFGICQQLRAVSQVPVLMLTARDEVEDRVRGLEIGADDYLVKPFAFRELLARVRALLRRHGPIEVLAYSDLVVDTRTRDVGRGSRRLTLTAKEYELLVLFMERPRQVLTRDFIMDRIWGHDYAGASNVLEVYVSLLRQKLEAGGEPRLLHTIRGAGYALRG